MKRVTIYPRVPTKEQNPDMQLSDLKNYKIIESLSWLMNMLIMNLGVKMTDRIISNF